MVNKKVRKATKYLVIVNAKGIPRAVWRYGKSRKDVIQRIWRNEIGEILYVFSPLEYKKAEAWRYFEIPKEMR